MAALMVAGACSGDDPPAAALCHDAQAVDAEALYAQFAAEVYPLMTRAPDAGGCAKCHSPANSLPLVVWPDTRKTMDELWAAGYLQLSGKKTLLAALTREDAQRMPLGSGAWPDEELAAVERLACNLQASALQVPQLCQGEPDPGNTLIRRLSNGEYDRTVADLTGDVTQPATGFPADQPQHGFDNVSSAQQISLGHFEQYHAAAEQLAQDTLLIPEPIALGFEAESLSAFLYTGAPVTLNGHGGPTGDHYHFQRIRSYVTTGLQYFPYDGSYSIEIRARGRNHIYRTNGNNGWVIVDDDVAPTMRVAIDGIEVDVVEVVGIPYDHDTFGPWQSFSWQYPLTKGTHTVRVWLDNVTYGSQQQRDVMLDVDDINVDGPMPADLPQPDEARIARFLLCDGSEPSCADTTIHHALTTLWRRPASGEEVARYATLINDALQNGDDFKDGVEAVLEAALLSPNFLFRPEIDPDSEAAATRPLDGYELATRLSYLLWSTTPDEPLLLAAADSSLTTDEELAAQIDRMLADPRASALTERFAAQWLQLDDMQHMEPSSESFPAFDEPLRQAMIAELQLLFQEFLEQDRDLLDILDADFTYLNDRLADHYGISLPGASSAFQRIEVGGSGRGGLLRSAGFLTLSSHPARTSPTKRGKWILEQLLCQPPGEPPVDADTSVDTDAADSLQEFLQQHREDPACGSCHASMDALGITLEHFDPLGRWRDIDDWGNSVEPLGELPTGQTLADHDEMIIYVKQHPGLRACITKKMLIYALGRDPQLYDSCAVDAVQSEFIASGHTLRGLLKAIVMSPMFRQRRPEKPGEYDYLNAEEGT